MQGAIFAVVGMAAGLVGTAVSNGLIAVRKALDPDFVPQNELPNVPLNAACWATHMGLSSNLRYQLLNGFEMARLSFVSLCTDTFDSEPRRLCAWQRCL